MASKIKNFLSKLFLFLSFRIISTANLGLFFIFFIFIFRLCFVGIGVYYGFYEFKFDDLESTFLAFAYHDYKPLCYILLMFLVLSLIPTFRRRFPFVAFKIAYSPVAKFLQNSLMIFLILALTLAFVGDYVYYVIYKNAFDDKILMLLDDGFEGIFTTAISGQYPLFTPLLAVLVFASGGIYTYLRIVDVNFIFRMRFCSLLLLAIFYFALLFAISFRSAQFNDVRYIMPSPPSNEFLRNIVNGPFRELFLIYRARTKLSENAYLKFAGDLAPEDAARKYFDKPLDKPINLLSSLEHKVKNDGDEYDNVFYIVGESFSYWHIQEFALTDKLKNVVSENGGVILPALQNASSTKKSLSTQIAGLFQMDLPINLKSDALNNLSVAKILKDLGYKTYFVYGGPITWGNLDKFTRVMGFDNLIFNDALLRFAKEDKSISKPYENAWGVRDDILFKFLSNYKFPKKSFVFVMSVANHPPYDTDVEGLGLDLSFIKSELSKIRHPSNITAKMIAHSQFFANNLADFIGNEMAKRSLIFVTGDHYDRIHPSINTPLSKTKLVPLIALSSLRKLYATVDISKHLDITPSIINLVAKKDYKYPSFGEPAISNTASARADRMELGYFSVADRCFIYSDLRVEFLNLQDNCPKIIDENTKSIMKNAYDKLDLAKALSAYILKNGFVIK